MLAADPSRASFVSSEEVAYKKAADEPDPQEEQKKNQTVIPASECCECAPSPEQNRVDEEERRLHIECQNFLQNTVYRLRYVDARACSCVTSQPQLTVRSAANLDDNCKF